MPVHRRASVYAEKGAAALVKGGVVSDPVTGDVLHDYDWTPMEAAEAVIDASGLVAEVERLRGDLYDLNEQYQELRLVLEREREEHAATIRAYDRLREALNA